MHHLQNSPPPSATITTTAKIYNNSISNNNNTRNDGVNKEHRKKHGSNHVNTDRKQAQIFFALDTQSMRCLPIDKKILGLSKNKTVMTSNSVCKVNNSLCIFQGKRKDFSANKNSSDGAPTSNRSVFFLIQFGKQDFLVVMVYIN
eukprot:Awhi_evm1s6728